MYAQDRVVLGKTDFAVEKSDFGTETLSLRFLPGPKYNRTSISHWRDSSAQKPFPWR